MNIFQGTRIQASVINKSIHEIYLREPLEGETYFMANFVVSRNMCRYRATTHEFKITLTPQSWVCKEKADLPLRNYAFIPIPEILKVKQPEQLDNLFGMYLFVLYYY